MDSKSITELMNRMIKVLTSTGKMCKSCICICTSLLPKSHLKLTKEVNGKTHLMMQSTIRKQR